MDTTEQRAAANLRTALWKMRRDRDGLLESVGSYLQLSPKVEVDLALLVASARRLIGSSPAMHEGDANVAGLMGDLLPDWDEDWILFERERLRQLQVHALEALCGRLSRIGRHGEAIDAGQAAVAAEPLRESAQRTLIAAHLAEGNVNEARRQYEMFRALLLENLCIEPSADLRNLVQAPS
jgi:DNA-binding SARP family transcriptional activator